MARLNVGDIVEVTVQAIVTSTHGECCTDVVVEGSDPFWVDSGKVKVIKPAFLIAKPKPGTLVRYGGWNGLVTDTDETVYISRGDGHTEPGAYSWSDLATNPNTEVVG